MYINRNLLTICDCIIFLTIQDKDRLFLIINVNIYIVIIMNFKLWLTDTISSAIYYNNH